MTCNLPPDACLKERRKAMSYLPGDPRGWTPSPCLNCIIGRERQMANHTPEPDPVDDPTRLKRPFKIEPTPCVVCGTTVNKPSYRVRPICKPCYFKEKSDRAALERQKHKCEQCGKPRTKYAKLCNACYKASRSAPDLCMEAGCERKSRRKGLCDHHYYLLIAPEERKRKKEANGEAAKRYREKSHRIAQVRMAKPKNHIVRYREVPNEAL